MPAGADSKEAANRAIYAPNIKDRRITRGQTSGKIMTRIGELFLTGDIPPHLTKEALTFYFDIFGKKTRLGQNRLNAEFVLIKRSYSVRIEDGCSDAFPLPR